LSGRSPQRNIGQGLKALSDNAEVCAAGGLAKCPKDQPRGGEGSRASAGSTLLVRKVIE
jgi:hypothetical protein